MNFHAEILEKNSPWLYIQTGVYITMGNIRNKRVTPKANKNDLPITSFVL